MLVVGTTQVSVPCSKQAVQFTDNKDELPCLDSDILDLIIRRESELSVSETPVVGLNRPPALSSTSSSNHSNVSYKKNRDVLKAQAEYDSQLDLDRYHDSESDSKLANFELKLPISNDQPDDYRRFIEIYLHERTQMLVCLEIDLQHLKLENMEKANSFDEADQTPFIGDAGVIFENDISNEVARKLRLID